MNESSFRRSPLPLLDDFLFRSRSLALGIHVPAIESAHRLVGLLAPVAIALVDLARSIALVRHDCLAGFARQAEIIEFLPERMA